MPHPATLRPTAAVRPAVDVTTVDVVGVLIRGAADQPSTRGDGRRADGACAPPRDGPAFACCCSWHALSRSAPGHRPVAVVARPRAARRRGGSAALRAFGRCPAGPGRRVAGGPRAPGRAVLGTNALLYAAAGLLAGSRPARGARALGLGGRGGVAAAPASAGRRLVVALLSGSVVAWSTSVCDLLLTARCCAGRPSRHWSARSSGWSAGGRGDRVAARAAGRLPGLGCWCLVVLAPHSAPSSGGSVRSRSASRRHTVRAAATVNTRTTAQPALRGRILDRNGIPLVDNTAETVVTVDRTVLADAKDGGRALRQARRDGAGRAVRPAVGHAPSCAARPAPRPPRPAGAGPRTSRCRCSSGPTRAGRSACSSAPTSTPGSRWWRRRCASTHSSGRSTRHRSWATSRRPTAAGRRRRPRPVGDLDLVGRTGLEKQYERSCAAPPGAPRSPSTPVAWSPGCCPRSRRCPDATWSPTSTSGSRPPPSRRCGGRWPLRAGAGIGPTARPRWSSTPRPAGSSPRRATPPTTRTSGPAGSARRPSRRSPPRRPASPLVNRVTSAVYPPASTFKVVSLPAAVRAGNSLSRHLRLHQQLPDRQPHVRQLRVARLRADLPDQGHRGLLRHDLLRLRLPVVAGAGRSGGDRPTRTTPSWRWPTPSASARDTGIDLPGERSRSHPRPRLEARRRGRHPDRHLPPGEHRLPGGRAHGPAARGIPQGAWRWRTAAAASSSGPGTRRTSPSARATSR